MAPSRRAFEPAFRAVIFDLDETLIDSRPAWRYTLEETLMSVANRRIDAAPLVAEYHRRPWDESLAIVLDGAEERRRARELCERIAARSAMKRLLVFEGTGMALDEIRAARIEIGAVSRLPHALALKQAQATGLDRFLSVLAATPAGGDASERRTLAARARECLAWFEREAAACLFIGALAEDLAEAAALGLITLQAGWAPRAEAADVAAGARLATPAAAAEALLHGLDAGLSLRPEGG